MNRIAGYSLIAILISPPCFANETNQQDDATMCKYGTEHMIDVARQSLKEKSSRPERIEKRRKLVEEWTARMEQGEDPCTVYADIQQAATTF